MNHKILPYETNKTGYFPADTVSLSILNTYNDQLSFLYGFYNLFAFECYYQDGSIIYNVELDWECPTLCRKEIPRSVLHNDKNFSIIDFIISSIDNGYYIYITLDVNKLNCYRNINLDFKPHPLIIYGYNQSKKELHIADYFDGAHYKNGVVSYDEVNTANNSVFSRMKILDPLCGTNDSILDIELIKYLKNCNLIADTDYICHSINLFLDGKWVTGNRNQYILNRRLPRTAIDNLGKNKYYEAETFNEEYGINAFWGIVRHIENCISSNKYIFNFRHIHLICLYYELFINKILILKQNFCCCESCKQFDKILTEANAHRRLLKAAVFLSIKYSKYSYKEQYESNAKKYLIDVNNIIKKEIQYIYDVNYIVKNILYEINRKH